MLGAGKDIEDLGRIQYEIDVLAMVEIQVECRGFGARKDRFEGWGEETENVHPKCRDIKPDTAPVSRYVSLIQPSEPGLLGRSHEMPLGILVGCSIAARA